MKDFWKFTAYWLLSLNVFRYISSVQFSSKASQSDLWNSIIFLIRIFRFFYGKNVCAWNVWVLRTALLVKELIIQERLCFQFLLIHYAQESGEIFTLNKQFFRFTKYLIVIINNSILKTSGNKQRETIYFKKCLDEALLFRLKTIDHYEWESIAISVLFVLTYQTMAKHDSVSEYYGFNRVCQCKYIIFYGSHLFSGTRKSIR